MFHDFVNIRIFTYVKIRLARWVSLILDKLDIKGIEGVLCNVKYIWENSVKIFAFVLAGVLIIIVH